MVSEYRMHYNILRMGQQWQGKCKIGNLSHNLIMDLCLKGWIDFKELLSFSSLYMSLFKLVTFLCFLLVISEEENPVDKLKACLSELCDIVEREPSVWSATQDFIKGIERVQHNPVKLASAMHALGRYSCLLMKKRAKTIRRGTQYSGLMLTSQPNAGSRRKPKLSIKRRIPVVRQSMTMSGPDHEYSQPEKRRLSGHHTFVHGIPKGSPK